MRGYWGPNSIPELRGLPAAQQRRLWQDAVRANRRQPRIWFSRLLILIMLAAGFVGVFLIYLAGLSGLLSIMGAMVWGAVSMILPHQLMVPAVRPWLAVRRAELAAAEAAESYHVPPASGR